MDRRKNLLVWIVWAIACLPGVSAATEMLATDIRSELIGGNFNTFDFITGGGAAADASVVTPGSEILAGASVHLDLEFVQYGSGPLPVAEAEFQGGTTSGNDLVILCGSSNPGCTSGSTLLAATVDSIFVTGFIPNGNLELVSIILGGLDGVGQSSITVLEDPFDLFSTDGRIKVEMTDLQTVGGSPYLPLWTDPVFDTDFTAQVNIQMNAPEPASSMLLGGALAALAAGRRRKKSRG